METGTGSIANFFATLMKLGIFAQAERENRRFDRAAKRARLSAAYYVVGLNGHRAIERRQRQIASGQLRAENGLVTHA